MERLLNFAPGLAIGTSVAIGYAVPAARLSAPGRRLPAPR